MEARLVRFLAHRSADSYLRPYPTGAIELVDADGQFRGFTKIDESSILIALAGTKSIKDVRKDCDVLKVHVHGGKVHGGFWKEFESIAEQLKDILLDNPGKAVHCCGHSLGAALAVYQAVEAARTGREVDLVTLECPNPGDAEYARNAARLGIRHTRITHGHDIIPWLPFFGYSNFGRRIHLDHKGRRIGRARGFFRRLLRLDALIVAWWKGEEYKDHYVIGVLLSLERFLSRLKGGTV